MPFMIEFPMPQEQSSECECDGEGARAQLPEAHAHELRWRFKAWNDNPTRFRPGDIVIPKEGLEISQYITRDNPAVVIETRYGDPETEHSPNRCDGVVKCDLVLGVIITCGHFATFAMPHERMELHPEFGREESSEDQIEILERPPSPEEVKAARTAAGGWKRAQLAAWGVSWPPPKGWRLRLHQAYQEWQERQEAADADG